MIFPLFLKATMCSKIVLSGLLLALMWDILLAERACDILYLREPVLTVDCNPYSGSAMFDLQCRVEAPAPVGSRLDILWFFRNESGHTVEINMNRFLSLVAIVAQNQTVMSGELVQLTSTITFGPFVDPIHAGGYFCGVSLDGSTASFSNSNAQTYTTQTDGLLNFNPCGTAGEMHSQTTTRCAGNISYSTTSGPAATDGSTANIQPTSTILSSPSLSSSPPTTFGSTLNTADVTTNSQPQTSTQGLSLWVYVLVGVAAVFAMIIIVLTILCIGLCLKKNKTTDSFKQKTPDLTQFTTNSMVTNGLYQHKDENNFTSGTHQSAHSQIADYNTLGERDYEIIDVNECKKDYNHLQRPSPPTVPGGRNGTFVFASSKEFHSMSTLTSQQGSRSGGNRATSGGQGAGIRQGATVQHGVMSPAAGMGMFPPKSASEGPEDHVYRELERKAQATNPSGLPSMPHPSGNVATLPSIYRSPTDSVPPDSARSLNRRFLREGIESIDEGNSNDVLRFPPHGRFNGVQPAGLLHKPETGNVFLEPANPASFPVHNYEKVTGEAEYETPIVSRKSKAPTAAAPPPPLAGRSSQTSMRGRSDSAGVRYETELTSSFSENSSGHYHRLVRNSGDHSSTSREASRQDFDDTVTDVTSVAMEDGLMTMDGSLTMDSTLTRRERNSAAFENPTSNSAHGSFQEEKARFPGNSIYDPHHSSSSATGSLSSSYIDQLHVDDDEEPMCDALFEEIVVSLGAVPDRTAVSLSRGSERMQNGVWSDRNGHASQSTEESPYSRLSGRGEGSTEERPPLRAFPPNVCHDVQNSNVDYGLADYSRLKTVV